MAGMEPILEAARMRKLFVPLAVLAVLASACSVSLGDNPATADKATTRDVNVPIPSGGGGGGDQIVAVVQRVLPSVVNVTTDQFSPAGETGQGVGTGFIVRSDGVIVTNCHVVEGASKITVFTSDATPKKYDARLIGGDCEHDLAILKVNETGLPTVSLGESNDLQLGQRVVALGYALALEGGPTVTTGIVSSLGRTIKAQDPNCSLETCGESRSRTYSGIIQTDAAINPGNSGGPLVNLQGQVVGINSAGANTAENIGFSIPIDDAKDTIATAESDPLAPSAYLGVVTQPVTADLAFQFNLPVDHGLYVLNVTQNGPAQAAGVGEGDVLLSVDGHDVSTPDGLGNVLADLSPGQKVDIEFASGSGDTKTVTVTLGSRPLPTTDLP
jgi:serine protease Do